MPAKKVARRKPTKTLRKLFAKQTIAEIEGLIKHQKKLDLQLKKIERHIKRLMGHQYFA